MKRRFKLFIGIGTPFGLLILYFIFFLNGCYYVTEGSALLSVYGKAQKIDVVLEKNEIDAAERQLLLDVKKIRSYAISELGLSTNDNYTTYIQIDQDYLATIVSACEKYSFKQYKWEYIFMGKMPYKGFFNKEDAVSEAKRLKDEDFDVYIRNVDAFSTLGILSDPVFSFMKEYSPYSLSNLLIHEQTHATRYFKKDIDFSENIAVFIADKGALKYIKQMYGPESEEYNTAVLQNSDSTAFTEALHRLYLSLDEMYTQESDKIIILEKKDKIIQAWKKAFSENHDNNFRTSLYKRVPELEINNAFLMTYRNYTGNQEKIRKLYEESGEDLKAFIEMIKQIPDDAEHPLDQLEDIVKKQKKQ